jgi:hypothetical protein
MYCMHAIMHASESHFRPNPSNRLEPLMQEHAWLHDWIMLELSFCQLSKNAMGDNYLHSHAAARFAYLSDNPVAHDAAYPGASRPYLLETTCARCSVYGEQ